MPVFPVRTVAAAALLAALATSACVPLKSHQGYVVDKDLVDAIQPGVDNRDSVIKTLGQPTLTGQFRDTDSEWYYVSRDSANFAYNDPKARNQQTLRIRFDPRGNVAAVDRFNGTQLIASIDMYGKKTPTLGRKRSFFDDLFGNIGTVGTGGGAPGGGEGGGGY